MMRSLLSGVSGLKNHQTRMDVIGNNIANVNTVAYKSERVTFQDTFNQTLKKAEGGGLITGGTNSVFPSFLCTPVLRSCSFPTRPTPPNTPIFLPLMPTLFGSLPPLLFRRSR
jgi:hypothetical protein